VHLREADGVADLGLAQVEEIAQRNHSTLTRIEAARRRCNQSSGEADIVEFRLLRHDRLGLPLERRGRAERRHQRRVPLNAARNAERIAAVAEMPPDLAFHAGARIRSELSFTPAFAAVDGGDQRQGSDLHEIVERLPATGEAARDTAHEREVTLDHPSARTRHVAGPQRLNGRHAINAKSFSFGLQ